MPEAMRGLEADLLLLVVVLATGGVIATLSLLAVSRVRARNAAPPDTARRSGPAPLPRPAPEPGPAPPTPIASGEHVAKESEPSQIQVPAAEARVDAEPPSAAPSRADGADSVAHHLAAGEAALAEGRDGEAAEALRLAIRLAARQGARQPQALARLHLGDIAFRAGDLTTACEHWQMARGLAIEMSRADGIAEAERRMFPNGCPTDWVLNDF